MTKQKLRAGTIIMECTGSTEHDLHCRNQEEIHNKDQRT